MSLRWEPFTISRDEDPVDATIFTGASINEKSRESGWEYCFASSSAKDKIYVSVPFQKTSSLYASETAFTEKLSKSELKHDAVQCPNSTDQSSVSVMRDHTISFNQEHGMTIVTLNWQL